MFAFIRGIIHSKDEHSLIIISHDIGYCVFVLEHILHTSTLEGSIELYLHHHIREDCSDLYGFESPKELLLYEQLLSISGIGPKTALAIMSAAPVEKIIHAIAQGNAGVLKGISGIGAKTAERIVIELRGKVVPSHENEKTTERVDTLDQEIIDALVELGYHRSLVQSVISEIPMSFSTPEDRLKVALKRLGSNKR